MSESKKDIPNKPKSDYSEVSQYLTVFSKILTPNVFFSAGLTTLAVTAVQNPLGVVIYAFTKGAPLPSMSLGLFGVTKALYQGAATAYAAGIPKGLYVTGSKTMAKTEMIAAESIEGGAALRATEFDMIETADKTVAKHLEGAEPAEKGASKLIEGNNRNARREQLGIITGLSLGDALLTQPEILADIKKAGIKNFKWYKADALYALKNLAALGRAGFGLRVVSSLTNTFSMTMFQDYCADFFPKGVDGKITNTAALASGAISGFLASLITFAPSQLRDKVVVSGVVDSKTNQINFKSTTAIIKEGIASLKTTNRHELYKFYKPILGARIMRSVATFMAVSFMFNFLGQTPADDCARKLGFFDPSKKDNKTIEPTKSESSSLTPK